MKMKRTWKKILLGVFATVMFVSLFTFVDMGWNVSKVQATEYSMKQMADRYGGECLVTGDTVKSDVKIQYGGYYHLTVYISSDDKDPTRNYDKFYYVNDGGSWTVPSEYAHLYVYSAWTNYGGGASYTADLYLSTNFSKEVNNDFLASAATCTSPAKYYYKCPKCNKKLTGVAPYENGSALGHSYTSKTVNSNYLASAATCTSPAKYYYKCSRCAAKGTSTYESGSALGHSYMYVKSGNKIDVICHRSAKCGQSASFTLNPGDCKGEIAYTTLFTTGYTGASVSKSGTTNVATPTVMYRGTNRDGSVYGPSATKPNDTGSYEAYIELGGQTVSCKFSIAPGGDIYKFDKGTGDAGTMDDQLVLAEGFQQGTKLNKNAFTKIGYHFKKWISSITGEEFDDEQEVDAPNINNPLTRTLTADWEANKYDVTFNNSGADILSGTTSATVTFDATPDDITIPKKNCSEFQGYYTAANGGGTQIFDKDGKAVSKWTITSDTTLYAHWEVKHDWGYEAKDNEIIATCNNEACKYSQKLTLNAEDSTYDKNSSYSGASITNQTDFPQKKDSSNIQYEGTTAKGVAYLKNSTAPQNAGTYEAMVTVTSNGTDYTAKKSFTIDKATQNATVSVASYKWGEDDVQSQDHKPTISDLEEDTIATVEYFYNENNSNENGTSWTSLTNKTLDAGTFYVYAEYTETDNYKSGTTATSSFTVEGLPINPNIIETKSPGDGSGVEYDREPHTADIEVEVIDEGDNPANYTITYATSLDGPFTSEKPTFTDAGNHKIYYRVKRFGYEVASGNVDVKINPKAITISNVKAKDKVYDGNTTATFDYADVSYEGIISGDSLSVEATGTFDNKDVDVDKAVTISALTLGGTSKNNYVLADSGHQNTAEANITQREVALEWDPTSFTYDETAKKPTATVVNLVSDDTCVVTVGLVGEGEAINAGEYTARATALDNPNYKLPSTVTQIFTINKIDQPTVTVTMDGFEYSDTSVPTPSVSDTAKENPDITYYYSLENKKTGGTEWKNVAPKSIEPDTYYMYAVLAETTNYNAYTTEPVKFVVKGEDIRGSVSVVNIDDNKVTYTYTGKKEHGITVNIPVGATIMYGTDEESYTLSDCPTYKDVGEYTIYYKVTKTGCDPVKGSATVVINKAPLTVTPDADQTKVYGDVDPEFKYTVKESDLKGDDTVSVVSGRIKRAEGENVADDGYEFSNKDLTADNYEITCTSGVKFMITPRELTADMVTLAEKEFEYTAETINVAANGNLNVKYNGADVATDDYELSGNTAKEKQNYVVTITGKRNFSGSVEKDWVITGATVHISNKESRVTRQYGEDPDIAANLNGFKDTDTVTYGMSQDSVDDTSLNIKNVGEYVVWYRVARDGFKSYVGYVTLIIEPKEVVITWDDTTFEYNGQIQTPTATVSNLEPGDICNVETFSDDKDAGVDYIAIATELTGENSENYKLPESLQITEYEITPKPLTLKAKNVSKYVGEKDPTLSYEAVGLCPGDIISGVSVNRNPGEGAGTYLIKVTVDADAVDPDAANKNYTITTQYGSLVISDRPADNEDSNSGSGNNNPVIPVVPVQKPVVLPIDALTANAANKNTKNTTGNNKGANLGADGTNAETDDLSGANGAGNLTLHLEVSEHSPIETASIETPVTKLLEGSDVFTTEEALAIKGGVDARVWVHIDKLDMSVVPDSVHDEILSAAKGLEDDNVELLYFDISLFKQIGDGEIINIHEPGTHIDITLELPESVINTDDKVVREYKILRLHDGVIDVIPTTYNPDTQTISFATDKFSTYVLAYIDKSAEEITEADNTDSITVNEVEKENSSTAIYIILFILLILAIAIIIFILYCRKKNEDTI